MPKEYALAQGIMTVSRPITDIPTAALFHGHSPTRQIQRLNNMGQYDGSHSNTNIDSVQQDQLTSAQQDIVWGKYFDEDGYEYYYNSVTGDHTYDIPHD